MSATTISIEGDVARMLDAYRRARTARQDASKREDERAVADALREEQHHALMLATVVSSAVDLAEAGGDRGTPSTTQTTPRADKPKPPPRFMTTKDYAEHRSVSTSTVKRWLRYGLPCSRYGRGLVRIVVADADR